MVGQGTYQDASTAVGEIYGHRVEVAMFATRICYGGRNGEGAEHRVQKDAIGCQGGRERLSSLANDIMQRHASRPVRVETKKNQQDQKARL